MFLILKSIGRCLPTTTFKCQLLTTKTCVHRSYGSYVQSWKTLKTRLPLDQLQAVKFRLNLSNLVRLIPRHFLLASGRIRCGNFLCLLVPFGLSKLAYAEELHSGSSEECTFPKTPPMRAPKLSLFGKIWETLVIFLRITQIYIYFIPIIVLLPFSYLNRQLDNLWWRLFLRTVEWTGPTFVKFGQWASTRRDLFSAEFCDKFSQLHRRVRPHSWFLTKQRLRQAFGKRWQEIFVKVEKRPVGSGCIAQVHKGYMHPDLIMDETILAELSEDLEFNEGIDFAEGLEIVGFGHMYDTGSNTSDYLHGLFGKLWRKKGATQSHSKGIQGQPSENQVKGQEVKATTTDAGVHLESQRTGGDTDPATATDEQPAADGSTEEGQQSDASQDQPEEVSLSPNYGHFEEEALVPVAIKVVHPGIYRKVYRDLSILRILGSMFEFIYPRFKWLSLSECIDEFSVLMTRQMDLRFEAECLEQFVENFDNVSQVRFPRVIRPYVRRNILVETYEEGEPISSFVKADAHEDDKLQKMLASVGVDALLKMVFEDNFVHGDLHPGNILVQNAELFNPEEEAKTYLVDLGDTVIMGVKEVECPVKLVMLDVGITSSLGDEDLQKFTAVFKAVILGDGEEVGQLFLAHSHYQDCQDVEAFKSEMGELVTQARSMTISLGKIQVARLLNDVFGVLSRHRVKMESNFISIMLAIFVLEGLGRSLDPQLDLLERARTVLL